MTFVFWLLLLLAPWATDGRKPLKVPISSKILPLGLPHLTRRFNPESSLQNAVVKVVTPGQQQLHIPALNPRASETLTHYVPVTVQCGNQQMFNDVLVDTGSAILWVGGEKPYQPGPSTRRLNSTFSVAYGVGGVSGTAFQDNVIIGDAIGSAQIIGSANVTQGFTLVRPIDGILGLGPSGSNAGDVSGFDTTPTFVETLVADKIIDHLMFGIFISPLGQNGVPKGTGEITFGGVDESRIKGGISWIPQNLPVNFHWEFNVTSFSFGKISLNVTTGARTDTGVLPLALPFDQFIAISNAYNGTIAFDNSALSGFLSFPSNASSTLPSLMFTLGGMTFSFPPSRYIVPRNLYPSLNVADDPTLVRTWIASGGPGMYFFGQKFLENAYSAYDMANHCVGFAHLV